MFLTKRVVLFLLFFLGMTYSATACMSPSYTVWVDVSSVGDGCLAFFLFLVPILLVLKLVIKVVSHAKFNTEHQQRFNLATNAFLILFIILFYPLALGMAERTYPPTPCLHMFEKAALPPLLFWQPFGWNMTGGFWSYCILVTMASLSYRKRRNSTSRWSLMMKSFYTTLLLPLFIFSSSKVNSYLTLFLIPIAFDFSDYGSGSLISLWDWMWGKYERRAPAITPPGIKLHDLHNHAKGSTCKVCGDTINEEYVICRDCGTPHHRKCWEYTGRCAVFACGCEKVRMVA